MIEGWSSHLWSDFDGNCIFVDGLGAIWKIFVQTNQKRPEAKVDHSVKMISNQFQGPSPVPRGPSSAKDSEKMFQIEARGQKQWNLRNNERRLELSSVVRFWRELHICGWFGCYLKDIHSDQPKEARGQSWPLRSDDHSVKMISNRTQTIHKYAIPVKIWPQMTAPAFFHYFSNFTVSGLWPLFETFFQNLWPWMGL